MSDQNIEPATAPLHGQAQHGGVRLDPVERAIADIAAGKAVVVVDDEGRERSGGQQRAEDERS